MNVIALDFVRHGYVPIGIHISWNDSTNEKQIVWPNRWTSATLDTSVQYFSKYNNGIAILTGDKSDLIVIDCDVLKAKDASNGMLDGVEIFKALIDKYGLPECPVARSSSGGRHYFFSLSKSLENGLIHTKNTTKISIKKGLLDKEHDCKSITVDTRGDNGCIIVAPTAYKAGDIDKTYEWIYPLVDSTDLPSMPSWCIELVNESTPLTQSGSYSRADKIKDISMEKFTSTTLVFHDHALFLRQTQSHIEENQGSPMQNIYPTSNGYNYKPQDRSKPCPSCLGSHTSQSFKVREICDGCYRMASFSSGCQMRVFNWETHPLLTMILESPSTDAPYARMLKDRCRRRGFEIVHTHNERFLKFNGIVWEELPKHVVSHEIEEICCPILDYLIYYMKPRKGSRAEEAENPEDAEIITRNNKHRKFVQARIFLRKSTNINNIIKYFCQMYTDPDIEKKLDTNPDILAVKNGIIDLKTGYIREGSPEDFIITQLDTRYNQNGETRLIADFVRSIFSEDQDTIVYVQKLLGYGITGHTKEQCFAIFTGAGSNGKSLFISLIEALMEKFYVTAAYDVFFKNERRVQAGGPSPHLAALKGARICAKEETEPKDKLNVEMLKIITGQSTVTTRQLYAKEYESFVPVALPILLCNHKPAIDVEDDAMLRRIKVVPFNNIYTTPEDVNRPYDKDNPTHRLKDPNLRAKLLTVEAQEQLLIWLVQGAVKWYKEGLGPQPASMINAFKDYRAENDKLQMFLDEKCELSPPGLQKNEAKKYFVNAGEFRKALETHGFKYLQKDLIEIMLKRGFKYGKSREVATNVYWGLRFISMNQ